MLLFTNVMFTNVMLFTNVVDYQCCLPVLFTSVVYQCCLQVLLFTSDVFFTDDVYIVIPHYIISF